MKGLPLASVDFGLATLALFDFGLVVFFLNNNTVRKSRRWGVNDFFLSNILAKPLKPGSSFLSLATQVSKHWSGMQGSPHFRCGMKQAVLIPEMRGTCSEWINVSLKPVTEWRLCHLLNMGTFSRLKCGVSNLACPSSNLLLFLLFLNKPFSQPTSLR